MSAARSDAATSTDDIVKGRPLCLFYFAHPFGVLSCEPPTVLAPAPPAPAPAAPAPAPAPAAAPSGAMARRLPAWPADACARRLPPYTRTLPPLKLPTPRDLSSFDGSDDVWSRSAFVPPERMSLPPIELPAPTPPPLTEGRAGRSRRPGPVGVRKPAARCRGAALARLLRRAVTTSGSGVEVSPRGVWGAPGAVRAAWQPQPPGGGASARQRRDASVRRRRRRDDARAFPPRTSWASNSSTIGIGGEEDSADGDGSVFGEMGPRAPPSAPASALPYRRYSVPETVMRRYQLAREVSEVRDEAVPASNVVCAARELVRRSALLRRMGDSHALSPCRCDTRSLDGSRSEVSQPLARTARCPDFVLEPSLANRSFPVATSNESRFDPLPTADILEIVVSETSPVTLSRPSPLPTSRLSDCNLNIDEYVSNILVDSLNSLTDKLESMTVSIGGGDGRISVVEKEIKVKLQNKGVNTVVHLSPTSNNQIIFGNRELCERDAITVPPSRVARLFCDEFQVSTESWHTPRAESPCASLVDSLDDPMSPRAAPPDPPSPPPPAPPLPPPTVPVHQSPLNPLPSPSQDILETCQPTPLLSAYTDMEYSPQREKCESFFIRMDNCACESENIVVADHMPEKIKQRLYRRHRRRELRAQGARRGATRRNAQRDIQRQCAALVDALIDDAIARVVREEHRYARIARRKEAPKENGTSSRTSNRRSTNSKGISEPRTRENLKGMSLTSQIPVMPPCEERDRSPPRRLYHKSEIHDGSKCIEILEIVEYTNTPRSSSETNSDESLNAARCRKSRIPVPIQDKNEQHRVRHVSAASPASLLTSAVTGSASTSRRAFVSGVDLCAPSSSLRFERVFDVIPEERSSLSVDSASEDMRGPPSAPPPPARRSAATSPLALAPPGSTSSFMERVPSQIDRPGHAQRSIGTQWAHTSLRMTQNSEHNVTNLGIELQEEDKQSSSESECVSASGAQPQSAQGERFPLRAGKRARRPHRAPHPMSSPPPPLLPPEAAPAVPAAHEIPAAPAPAAAINSGGDGWSLTLAGSCRAALPSRLDLRLRFPACDLAAPAPAAPSSRSDLNTDRYSDAGSQDQEWSMCKQRRCSHAAAAIRYDSPGESPVTSMRGRLVRRRKCAADRPAPTRARAPRPSDALPALAAPALRRSHLQEQGAHCHCCAAEAPEPATGSSRGAVERRRNARDSPAHSRLDHLHHATVLATQKDGAEMKAAALAVLGCAIVPERRLAPPTASQRDLRRARLAARAHRAPRAPLTRRHSVATDRDALSDNNIHCLCYTYT